MTGYQEEKYRENCKSKCVRMTALGYRETTSIQLNQGGCLHKKNAFVHTPLLPFSLFCKLLNKCLSVRRPS